jgi:capsular polysaccharide transport system permease protein
VIGMHATPRSPLQIATGVWHALLMREALRRLFPSRGAWAWLLVEPLFHAAYLTLIYTLIKVRAVGGIDTVVWLLSGLMGFFLFSRTAAQVGSALTANRPLFTYRQVKPFDTLFVRAVLEGAVMVVIVGSIFFGASLFGHVFAPDAPLTVFMAFFSAWLIGFGWGVIVAIINDLVPELGNLLDLLTRPLYLISGVIFPLSVLPQQMREWLMINPLAHVLENIRLGFASHYHAVPESSATYPYLAALVMIFLGLLLMRRFEWKVLAK